MPNPVSRLACYRPCACGAMVLHGVTREGAAVCVEVQQQTYVALWEPEPKNKEPHYIMVPSMGYPVHVCALDQKGS